VNKKDKCDTTLTHEPTLSTIRTNTYHIHIKRGRDERNSIILHFTISISIQLQLQLQFISTSTTATTNTNTSNELNSYLPCYR
jgi:hypothetical protein